MIKLTINNLLLTSSTNLIPAQGSANIPVELINASTDYSDYALIPCVGWTKNGIIISTTREVIDSGETKTFTIPSEAFLQNGLIYISVGLVKDNENAKTQTLAFKVSMAPTSDVQLPSDGSWETAVSSLVTSLFNNRFENEINQILENSKTLNEETENLQRQINNAINYLGDYEWSGTQIRFKKGDGTWGDYKDIAGEFVTKKELSSVTKTVKQLYLIMHPIGSIIFTTSSINPGVTFGGTWIEWGKGRVPVGVNTADIEFNEVEKIGGKKEQVLRASIGAVSSDTSSIGYAKTVATPNHNVYSATIWGTSGNTEAPRPANHATEVWQENGQGPTTLQPYITCYMWKRTA